MATRPDASTLDLAASLITSGVIVAQLGLDDEAVSADREALGLYCTLLTAYHHVFCNDLINAHAISS